MDETTTRVALIRSDRRRGGVAEALALVDADLRRALADDPNPILIPAAGRAQAHPDTLSAVVDSILAGGVREVTVSSVEPKYQAELWGRAAKFTTADILASDASWSAVTWNGPAGEPGELRIPSAAAASCCRVVVGVARPHETFRMAFGLAALAGLVHPADRDLMGRERGRLGLLSGPLVRGWLAMRSISGGMRPTPPERRRLGRVERATRALAALASHARPSFSVVDAFDAGRGTIVAGADPLAVDAVAAAALGFDPLEIGHLRMAHSLGLGTADLARIEIVGAPLVTPRRRLRRDPADRLLRLASAAPNPASLAPPRPHFATVPMAEGTCDAHRV